MTDRCENVHTDKHMASDDVVNFFFFFFFAELGPCVSASVCHLSVFASTNYCCPIGDQFELNAWRQTGDHMNE